MLPEYVLQTTIIRGSGPHVLARESRRKVRYVVSKTSPDGSTTPIPAVSAHHAAEIIQQNGGHFSGWDVYNFLGHCKETPPKCAERIPACLRLLRYCDYVAEQGMQSQPEPEDE